MQTVVLNWASVSGSGQLKGEHQQGIETFKCKNGIKRAEKGKPEWSLNLVPTTQVPLRRYDKVTMSDYFPELCLISFSAQTFSVSFASCLIWNWAISWENPFSEDAVQPFFSASFSCPHDLKWQNITIMGFDISVSLSAPRKSMIHFLRPLSIIHDDGDSVPLILPFFECALCCYG